MPQVQLHPAATRLPFDHQGPFVRHPTGAIVCFDARQAHVSRDDGGTWTAYPLFREPARFETSIERALLCTRAGTIIAAWVNRVEMRHPPGFKWGGGAPELAQWVLPTYVSRSHDGGRTWDDPVLLNRVWCGCLHSFIQLRGGRLVLVAQEIVSTWRHATFTFVSDDEGLTWQRSNILDIGQGCHDHAGSCEATVLERRDGSLYLLIRNETGFLYEAVSADGGLTWTDFQATTIPTVTCCPQLYRLADGAVALLWNAPPRYDPRDPAKRDELALAISTDDARTWSPACIVAADYPQARPANHWWRVAYPYLFELRPGEFWITTMQGDVRIRLAQADLPRGSIPMPPVAIMFGDSTTARRPGLVKEPYSVRVQKALEEAGSTLAIANQGIGGDSTRNALARFERDVLALSPRIVVLQFGINDAAVDVWQDPPAAGPRVPPAEFAANLRQMVRELRRRRVAVILMTTNRIYWSQTYRDLYGRPPYDVNDPEGFNRLHLDRYNDLIREIAANEQVPLVDVNAAYAAHANPAELLLPDLLHPADAGHELVAKLLVANILAVENARL